DRIPPHHEADGDGGGDDKPVASEDSAARVESVIQTIENCVASQMVIFIFHIILQLRNLMAFVSGGLLLVLIAVTSYPFQPHHLLMLYCWTLILVVAAASIYVFVQLERDEVLSLITRTKPGEITWDWSFVAKIGMFVFVPILSLVAAQFP